MSTATSALERAHFLLRQDMYGYLDAVEMLTDETTVEDEDILVVAREHLPRLIPAVRGTLSRHRPDAFGHRLGCPPGWANGQYTRAVGRAQWWSRSTVSWSSPKPSTRAWSPPTISQIVADDGGA
ncbi:hypothetical protein JOF56_006001 [Kibdelosporangium banguiense]|uniref:Uncharacterized protein n=1 Tax=Kibdelosporangium banguiense TaxID=1365924 RepID=A0ABS4TNY3_9PSEU|nr:hypothetical protein [Kibdelosporangium banguiense]MBP2325616.1 hypothetical protein [Kibdelosporangium banguiense]